MFRLELDVPYQIEKGLITADGAVELNDGYEQYIRKLGWTPEQAQDFQLTELRRRIQWCHDKMKEIENKNYEERKEGVSFSDRKHYLTKLEALKNLKKKYYKKGVELKEKKPTIPNLIKPGDVDIVERLGIERYLSFKLNLAHL